jgi:6-pyruvoyltetrahydropterin/6-carboxytetrahydropterin synthase
MRYAIIKTLGAERGISATFRQWAASSHCRFLHGYALSFEFTLSTRFLDTRNWVVDYGGFKDLEAELRRIFDHKVVVSTHDPELPKFFEMMRYGLADLTFLTGVSTEMFAALAARMCCEALKNHHEDLNVLVLESVVVSEHGSNAAMWVNDEGLTVAQLLEEKPTVEIVSAFDAYMLVKP